jgi:RNA polymerase sigma-70 factor (ECF subfamily)
LESIKALSDHELLASFINDGRPETAFRELMSRYKQKVYWQIRRILPQHDDADEVTQIVFIKLWKHADSFRFDSALSSFIYRIAYNESMSFLKQKKNTHSFDDALDADGHLDGYQNNGALPEAKILFRSLMQALKQLPDKQRLVFEYRYFDNLQYKEISDITGTSEGALKASYHIALEKLKKTISEL